MLSSCDCLIVGGGAIGLSIAYELARRGVQATVIDRGLPGREASWAGAGIIPPVNRLHALHPLDALRGLGCELHPHWSAALREETGVDNGYRRCGGFYLARSASEAALLTAWRTMTHEEGVTAELLTPQEAAELEPALRPLAASGELKRVGFLPEEAQIRNPWHLAALLAACKARQVQIWPNTELLSVDVRAGRVAEVTCATSQGEQTIACQRFCLAAGAWSRTVAAQLGVSIGVLPVRGQIVLFRCRRPPFVRILNEGSRYLVAREDGRVLAGATEEEAGFDKSNTAQAITELTGFASSICNELTADRIETTWAGLRPGTLDGMPYLGAIPGLSNAFLAAGHFRNGLQMSPATAVVMAQLIVNEPCDIDLAPFRVGRG